MQEHCQQCRAWVSALLHPEGEFSKGRIMCWEAEQPSYVLGWISHKDRWARKQSSCPEKILFHKFLRWLSYIAGGKENGYNPSGENLTISHKIIYAFTFWLNNQISRNLLRWLSGKETACDAGDMGDVGSIPGSERSPERGNGNPVQHSCLENPMDRGAWWATVHGVANSHTWLSTHTYTHTCTLTVHLKQHENVYARGCSLQLCLHICKIFEIT